MTSRRKRMIGNGSGKRNRPVKERGLKNWSERLLW
jgi:hypothetical protein